MERKKVISWFIISIMVLSTIGFALVSLPSQETEEPASTDVRASIEENLKEPELELPDTIAFSSGEINARVEKVLPELVLTASTDETEIYKINALIMQVPGIKNINSSYRLPQNQAISKSIIFFAEISLAAGTGQLTAVQEIQDKTKNILFDLSAAKKGIISFEKTLKLSNKDLNLSKEHSFEEPLSEAYLNLDTIENDEIIAEIFFNFNKNIVVKSIGNETSNVTAEPLLHSVSTETKIIELKNDLLVEGKASHENKTAKEELESSLKQGFDLNSTSLNLMPAAPSLEIQIDVNDLNASQLINDLNAFLDQNQIIQKNLSIAEQKITIALLLDSIDSINSMETSIINFLKAKNVMQDRIKTVKGTASLNAELAFNQAISSASANDINSFFSGKGFYDLSIKQKALVSKEVLLDKNYFDYDQNFVEVTVKTGHAAGDLIELDGMFYSSRNKALMAFLNEKQ